MAGTDPIIEELDEAIRLLEEQAKQLKEIRQQRLAYLEQYHFGELSPIGNSPAGLSSRIALAQGQHKSIQSLGLSPVIANHLRSNGLMRIGQLLLFSPEQLMKRPQLGPIRVAQIHQAVFQKEGLLLATELEATALSELFNGLQFPLITILVRRGITSLEQAASLTQQEFEDIVLSETESVLFHTQFTFRMSEALKQVGLSFRRVE